MSDWSNAEDLSDSIWDGVTRPTTTPFAFDGYRTIEGLPTGDKRKNCDISGCKRPNAGWLVEGRLNDETVWLFICDEHHRMLESPLTNYSVTLNGTIIGHKTLMTQSSGLTTER